MRTLGSVKPEKLQHEFPPDTRADATMAVEMAPNLEWVKGEALGQITASKKFAKYNNANNDGTETCVGVAAYSGKTDAQGRVFLGEDDSDSDLPMTGFCSVSEPTLEIYYAGIFKQSKLTGIDSAAIADLRGRVINDMVLIPS